MRCHYDVLGVPRDADDAEIKKNYRKMALKNHPDKNPDKIEEYTKIFREIQSAYDVLSDKQERAFYDKHREAILRGGEDFVDDALDLMQYFNTSVYSGFNDEPDGFYAVFENVFRTVATEEEAYLEGESADAFYVPEFGISDSDYESVVAPFYAHWLSYCTRKSFVWKDKYDIRQAPNRPTQRLMEKENKKIRDTFKKKRNEEVRALVQFVRKRDPRVKANRKKMEAAKQESKLKMEQKRVEDIRKRNEGMDEYKEQDWMVLDDDRLDDIDSHFDEHFGGEGPKIDSCSDNEHMSDIEQEMVDEFYCIACEKTFKSQKALSNHEKSKKHKENVQLIKNEMEEELANEFDLDSESQKDTSLLSEPGSTGAEMIHRVDSMTLTENVIRRNVIEHTTSPRESDIPEDSILTHSTDSLEYTKQKGFSRENSAKIKDRKKMKKLNREGMKLEAMLGDSPLTDSIQVHKNRKEGKGKDGKKLFQIDSYEDSDSATDNDGSPDSSKPVIDTIVDETNSSSEEQSNKASKPATEKRKSRRNKGAKSNSKKIVEECEDDHFICSVCSYEFPSRNKLFSHIKTEGHAQLKETKTNKSKSKSKNSASKK